MSRQPWVLVHRYVGLAIAAFLAVAGITGSLLAFFDELEEVVSPQLFRIEAPSPGAQPLDPLTLRERVLAGHPQWSLDYVNLRYEPGKSFSFFVQGGSDDEVFVDPYSGKTLGSRKWGDISQGTKNLMPFIYQLHYSLALGTVGIYLFGIAALLWTLDCFVGLYLTLPVRRRMNGNGNSALEAPSRGWWARWKSAWLVRWRLGSYKLNFDLHRAGGLWVWAMLLVVAWSSVAFNLREVYNPVTRTLLDYPDEGAALPSLASPLKQPALNWRTALETGRRHMATEAQRRGFLVNDERWLDCDTSRGLYSYSVNSDRDIGHDQNGTAVWFDANTGALRLTTLPTGEHSGTTVTNWLYSLHMAQVWGLPFRVFVCAVGLIVALLSVTGVIIWWRKRRARIPAEQGTPARHLGTT